MRLSLSTLFQKFSELDNFSKIPSIVFRKSDKVIDNQRLFLSNGDPIPKPDYSLIEIEKTTLPITKKIHMSTLDLY